MHQGLEAIQHLTVLCERGALPESTVWETIAAVVKADWQEPKVRAAVPAVPIHPGPVNVPIVAAPDNNAIRDAIGKAVAPKPKRTRNDTKGAVRTTVAEFKALSSFARKNKLGAVSRNKGGWVSGPALAAWVEAGRPGV